MTKARKIALVVLILFFVGVGAFTASVVLSQNVSSSKMETTEQLFDVAKDFYESNRFESAQSATVDNYGESGSDVENGGPVRLTQRITVYNEGGMLPYSGTIVKSNDAFYPGTYKISFSNNAILTSEATVSISMPVDKGDIVYVLTGNKDDGYRQYAEITVEEDGKIEFSTMVLQNYTLSTTDICSAQEAMASIIGD